ncbi:ATPase family AAA domain-containing protein At1g05910-like isoform X2 [Macadamia integrifolia]|uniref:ATPase family AAA domain-containing protein At1g05910-like isoform X2 n=1 Tax=Macadamia integrifolia TaxID=60698 RepID=UPI001C4EAB94|nr:ATPase family AAA domain-containing protein At1g05910-like isoform X2 [Macadamia integrifolia]
MLSQMDPALVSFCDKIAVQGGPTHFPDVTGSSGFPISPVVQQATVTRASARLRNVQPEVNLTQSYEVLKRMKKNIDFEKAAEDESQSADPGPSKVTPAQSAPSQEPDSNGVVEGPEKSSADVEPLDTSTNASSHIGERKSQEDAVMSDGEISSQVESLKQCLVDRTEGYGVPELESLYTRMMKGVIETKLKAGEEFRPSILRFLLRFAEDHGNL